MKPEPLVPFFEDRKRSFYKYPMSIMPLIILPEGFEEYEFENKGKDPKYSAEGRNSWIQGILRERSSKFYDLITQKFLSQSYDSLLLSILLEHGIFNRKYFEKNIRSQVVKRYYDENIDVSWFRDLLNELPQRNQWRDKPRGYYITKDNNAIYVLTEHIYEQTLLRVMPELEKEESRIFSNSTGAYKQLKLWFKEHSTPRKCGLCNRTFRVVDIPDVYYYGSDAFKDCCFSCPVTYSPTKKEMKSLIPAFIEACGFIPNSDIGPTKYSFTSRIPNEKKLNVFYAYGQMGGIYHVKAKFDSWFEALLEANVLPDGVLPTSRGLKCLATDSHVCYSLDEQLIDNWLSANGIPHEREPNYPVHPVLNDRGRRRADWKIRDTFVEYFGLTGDKDYDKKSIEKIQLAKSFGIDLISLYPNDLINLDKKLARLK